MRRLFLVIAIVVMLAPAAQATSHCEITNSPAATLLLPYFEVETTRHVSDAANTIFTVINTSRLPQIARVTIWSDYGYPVLWFNVYMTGYDVQPVSLYDVLALGRLPQTTNNTPAGGRSASSNPVLLADSCSMPPGVSDPVLASVRTMLTTGVRDAGACRVGGSHANAAGYVTIDLVRSCSTLSPLDISYYSHVLAHDNVLTGDYEYVFPDRGRGNYAGGSPLVHIKSTPAGSMRTTFYDRFTPPGARTIDRRQPLPSMFAARFIQGGTTQFETDLVIWREGVAPGSAQCVSANAAMPVASVIRFDEEENPTMLASPSSATMPAAAAFSSTAALFPPMHGASLTGWMLINLDNRATVISSVNPYSSARPSQNWVVVKMRAEGRYGINSDATQIGNGCGTDAVAASKKVMR